jgi:hypothetical protein
VSKILFAVSARGTRRKFAILVSILPGAESESMISCETCAAAGPKLGSKDASAMA